MVELFDIRVEAVSGTFARASPFAAALLFIIAAATDALDGSLRKLRELEKLQAKLLEVAQRAVKPGGRIVYSVCTLNPGEELQPEGEIRRLLPHRDRTDGFYISAVGG